MSCRLIASLVWRILALLAVCVGVPHMVLATTTPARPTETALPPTHCVMALVVASSSQIVPWRDGSRRPDIVWTDADSNLVSVINWRGD